MPYRACPSPPPLRRARSAVLSGHEAACAVWTTPDLLQRSWLCLPAGLFQRIARPFLSTARPQGGPDGRPSLGFAIASLLLGACASPLQPAQPVLPEAALAFAEAKGLEHAGAGNWRDDARVLVTESMELQPDWLAPQRFLDDMARDELRGHSALAGHLEALAKDPHASGAAYLAGRLEGVDGAAHLRGVESTQLHNAWVLHGRAWLLGQKHEYRAALALEERAYSRARSSFERVYFSQSGARFCLRLGEGGEALDWLYRVSKDEGLYAQQRLNLGLAMAPLEMRGEALELRLKGYWRAIGILLNEPLKGSELGDLVAPVFGMIGQREGSTNFEELNAALAAFDTPARRRMRARLFFDRGARELALGMVGDAGVGESSALRAERIARGGIGGLIEAWLQALPRQVLGADGLPLRSQLRRLVELARAPQATQDGFELGEALLDAGWFKEAGALANHLASEDLERALELEKRANAGRAILHGLARIFDVIDRKTPYRGPQRKNPDSIASVVPSQPQRIHSLNDLIDAVQPLLDRHARELAIDLSASPRVSIGPVATLLHPGPRFGPRDEARGLGIAGEEVPGMARALAQLGRFGVFGSVLGMGAPDGAVLRRLYAERVAGEHLGVGFRGNRVWCQGADLGSAAARRGAGIAGAAVHEGYWIDVAAVRPELKVWNRLEAEFFSGAGQLARRALDAEGPRLPGERLAQGDPDPRLERRHDSEERQRPYAPLGEADRIRLAVLLDLRSQGAEAGQGGWSMSLERLLEVTARHEEGHLTDQTRFLPLSEHLYGVLSLLAQVGFSGARLSEELEYRAQLICIAVAEDPRMPLAECVAAIDMGVGLTPHAAAYRRLIADLLSTLEHTPALTEKLDPKRYWVHQLHRLKPEEVRQLAEILAQEKGLVGAS